MARLRVSFLFTAALAVCSAVGAALPAKYVGSWKPKVENAPHQPPVSGTLDLRSNNSFKLSLLELEPNGSKTRIVAEGQIQASGKTLTLITKHVTVNGTSGDGSKLTMSLTDTATRNKLVMGGVFADALERQSPGGKFYWVK